MRQATLRTSLRCLALIAGTTIGGVLAHATTNKEYCAADGTNLVLIVDVTTAYDAKDKEVIVAAMGEIFDSLKGGERIAIRTITDTFASSDRLVDRCVPRCPHDDFWSQMLKCSEGTIRDDTRRLKNEITAALRERLANVTELPRSDIVRTISSVGREEMARRGRAVLYVYSDLLENSDLISMRQLFSAPNANIVRHVRKLDLIPDLTGAEVRCFGVARDATLARRPLAASQLQKLREFWKAYFAEAKVRSIEIEQNIPVRTNQRAAAQ